MSAVANTVARNRHGTPPLLVRAWYHSSVLGFDEQLNVELVNSLPAVAEISENEDEPMPVARMGVWAIRPRLYLDDTPRDECSGFTCVEIDLFYDPPTSPGSRIRPKQAARVVFYTELTERMSSFMESKDKKPMYFTMHPDPAWWEGSGLPHDLKLEYTFVKFGHSFAVALKPVALSSVPKANLADEIGSQLGSSAKEVRVAVGDICSKIFALSIEVQQGASPAKLLTFVRNAIETAKVPGLDDAFESSKLEISEDIKRSWTKMIVSAACFRRLGSGVADALETLSEGRKVHNSTLHGLVTDMTVARVLFGQYESEVAQLCKLLKMKYNNDPSFLRRIWKISLAVCGVAAVAGLGVMTGGIGSLTVPAFITGTTCGVVGGTSAVASGAGVYCDSSKRRGKKIKVATLDENIVKMRNTLHEAQMAVALMFCHQVLQVPVDALANPQEREEILENLGIDLYQIAQDYRDEGEGFASSRMSYKQELVQDRLKRFLKAYKAVGKQQDEIADDLNIKVGTEPRLVLPEAVMHSSYGSVKSITAE